MDLKNIILSSVTGSKRQTLYMLSPMGIYLEIGECHQEFKISYIWSNVAIDQEFLKF